MIKSLINHTNTHIRESPLACPNCGNKFKGSEHMATHIEVPHITWNFPEPYVLPTKDSSEYSETGIEITSKSFVFYPCEFCNLSFKSKYTLKVHIATFHNNTTHHPSPETFYQVDGAVSVLNPYASSTCRLPCDRLLEMEKLQHF